MSSNNRIIISKEKGKFIVYHDLCVDNEFVPEENDKIGEAKTMEKAVKIANKFMAENIVEYGISFMNIERTYRS